MAEPKSYTVNLYAYGNNGIIPYLNVRSPLLGYVADKWHFMNLLRNANVWMYDASSGKKISMKNIKDYYPEEGGGGDDPQPGGNSKLEGIQVPHLEMGEGEYDAGILDGNVTPYPVTEDT